MGGRQCYECQKGVSSKAAECSAPHSNKASRGNTEMNGRRGTGSTNGKSNMEKVKTICRCKIMNGFKSEKYFVVNTVSNGEPMKLL